MRRSTDRAILEKKPSTRLSQEPCFGVNTRVKRPSGGEPPVGFFGNVRRMVVEDQLDGGIGRISGVKLLEETNELARSMAISDAGVDLAGEQVDPGQQAQRAVALIFMIACPARLRP